jgi:hypothetical protein
MTGVKTITQFLVFGTAVKRVHKAKLGCRTRSALAARQNFGRRDASQQHIRVSNTVGGRVSKQCEHGIRTFLRRLCVSRDYWFRQVVP